MIEEIGRGWRRFDSELPLGVAVRRRAEDAELDAVSKASVRENCLVVLTRRLRIDWLATVLGVSTGFREVAVA